MKLLSPMRSLLAGALMTMTALLVGATAQGQNFSFQPVQIAGATRTDTYCVNNQGYLVGAYQTPDFVNHPFLYANGSLTEINPPNSGYTILLGVNASKLVSGYYLDPTFTITQAFTWQNGVFTLLNPTPTAGTLISSTAFQVNDAGKVVGGYTDSLGAHAYAYQNGVYTTYNVPNHSNPILFGVNNVGLTTAQALNVSNNYDSYYFNGSQLFFAPVPGAVGSYIHGVNLSNTAVYSFTDAQGIFRGSANYRGRSLFYPVDYPGAVQTFPDSITDANLIAGNAVLVDDTGIGFIARPVGARPISLSAAFNKTVVKTGPVKNGLLRRPGLVPVGMGLPY